MTEIEVLHKEWQPVEEFRVLKSSLSCTDAALSSGRLERLVPGRRYACVHFQSRRHSECPSSNEVDDRHQSRKARR